MDFCLDVVSDQRDTKNWPNPNEYEITLNRELHNVTNIKLIAAQIPLSQTLINGTNNTFPVNDTYVNLPNINVDSGEDFANLLKTYLTGTAVSNVEYNSNTETLTYSNSSGNLIYFDFYGGQNGYTTQTNKGTLANELGFSHSNVENGSNVITSGPVNLFGPTSIVIRLSTNGDDITRDVYNSGSSNVSSGNLSSTESNYFGRLITKKRGEFLEFKNDYPVESLFHKGPESAIKKLKISFYYTIGTKLVPYDFRSRNHTLKFKITCNLDKLSTLEKQKVYIRELPPPVELKHTELPRRFDKNQVITVLFICLMAGLLMLILSKR